MAIADKPERIAIPNYSRYEIDKEGRIFSLERGELTPYFSRKGYRILKLIRDDGVKKRVPVHQAVLITFVGPKPSSKHETRHLDGDKSNNRLSNLCWGTSQENSDDMLRLGERQLGEDRPNALLTEEQVREIRRMKARGMSSRQIAPKFGVGHRYIAAVCIGEYWKHTMTSDAAALKAEGLFLPDRTLKQMVCIDGETKSVSEWAAIAGIWPGNLKNRLRKGGTGQKLLSPRSDNARNK